MTDTQTTLYHLISKQKVLSYVCQPLTAFEIDKIIRHKAFGHQFENATFWYAVEIATKNYRQLLIINSLFLDKRFANMLYVDHE